MCTIVASQNKVILWGKNSHHQGTRNSIVPSSKNRNLLDTPDPKDKMPTVQIQNMRPLRARIQVNKWREIKVVWYNGKRERYQDLSFWECMREPTHPYSKT